MKHATNSPIRALLVFASALSLGGAGSTQGSGSASVAARSFGVVSLDEASSGSPNYRAAGPTYKADFRPGEFEFTPSLGPSAEHALSLGWSLDSVRREGVELLRGAATAAPRLDGSRVVYDHGLGIDEVYEVRLGGIEQSFVFPERLAGSGDLVVRLRLETELALPPLGERESVRFEGPLGGGVRVEKVVGVDADGRRANGSLRRLDRFLELVLPASFVDRASYPLVLDPFVGSTFGVHTGENSGSPDVAYDVGANGYLVVWEQRHSLFDVDIHGQRIDLDGNLVGPIVIIEDRLGFQASNPTVAAVAGTDHYVVAWQETQGFLSRPNISCRTVNSLDGGVPVAVQQLTIGLPGFTFDPYAEPDVGGSSVVGDGRAVLVWESALEGIVALSLDIASSGIPTYSIDARKVIGNGKSNDTRPAVTKSGGADGRFLIAWQRYFDVIVFDHDVLMIAVDGNLNLLSNEYIESTIGPDEQNIDVAGDGNRFLVAFESAPTLDHPTHVIGALLMTLSSGNLLDAPVDLTSALDTDAGNDVVNPAVMMVPSKFFVAAQLPFVTGNQRIVFDEISAASGLHCGSGGSIEGTADRLEPAFASRFDGDPSSVTGEGFLVFESNPQSFTNSDVSGLQISAWGNTADPVNLGGGCGNAGMIALENPPALGHPDFRITLEGADPMASLALLNLSVPGAPLVLCDSCVLNAFDWLLPASVVGGVAEVSFPIPCKQSLHSAKFEAQWMLGLTASSPCSAVNQISFSDRLEIRLGN